MVAKKILFADLDGTLLDDNKKISAKNRKAIRKMLEQGHYFVIATGRPVASAIKVVRDLGLNMPGYYMIAFNGAVIYDCSADCILAERKLSIECVEYLFAEAKKYGLHVQTYDRTHVLTRERTKEIEYYAKSTNMPYKLRENLLDSLNEEPNKILVASLEDCEKLQLFQKDHMGWQENRCNSFFSCDRYLEYCPLNTDKGSGCKFLMEFLNILPGNTVAVGDERNDIPMLRIVQTGIAMKNGHEEARAAADYVTNNDNEHDAMAEIIEKYILNEE